MCSHLHYYNVISWKTEARGFRLSDVLCQKSLSNMVSFSMWNWHSTIGAQTSSFPAKSPILNTFSNIEADLCILHMWAACPKINIVSLHWKNPKFRVSTADFQSSSNFFYWFSVVLCDGKQTFCKKKCLAVSNSYFNFFDKFSCTS